MPIKGQNNIIKIVENDREQIVNDINIDGLKIDINGNNNTVIIELPAKYINSNITIKGNNGFCHLKAARGRTIRRAVFWVEDGGILVFGSRISSSGAIKIISKAGKKLEIGDECMFAGDITVRNDDGHVILDKDTNEVINPPADVVIENNVWIGSNVMIFKGAYVKRGSVIGAMSLVNKKFEKENVIIAGVPAKIIRENIAWNRNSYYIHTKNK